MPETSRVVVLIWDGLRPDFVRPALTPNLCGLGDGGVVFSEHRAVFPSKTRVSASSIATGCYPGTHGIVGNALYIPAVSAHDTLNTGDHEALQALARDQPLLARPTLAERLRDAGRSFAIVSSGSPGSSWLQCAPGSGAMVNVRGVVHPEALELELRAKYDDLFPAASFPARARNCRLTEIIVDELRSDRYDVVMGWFCDPDFTQHEYGLGAEQSLAAIEENDARLGTIVEAAGAEGVDVLVGSEHGFSTPVAAFDHRHELAEAGFRLQDLVWMDGSIALRPDARDCTPELVAFLQGQDWAGPIFTRGDGREGWVPGTFSFRAAQLEHPRTPQVVFSRRWSDLPNAHGVPGVVYGSAGVATHGTCCPYDMHSVLVAGGPRFRSGITSEVPSGLVDLAPTVYYLATGDVLNDVDGRVLTEALRCGCGRPSVHTETLETCAPSYRQFLEVARVEGTEYINSGWRAPRGGSLRAP